MQKLKIICQILIAFIIAMFGYTLLYEPHQEIVRAAVQQQLPQRQSTVPQGSLRITMLDVGQADAILLQDGKRNIMVDVGDSRQDKMGAGGRKALENALAQAGVQKINTVIVTHHHADHMGNIKWMAGRYGVSNIYDNAMPNEKNPASLWLNKELRAGHYHSKVLKAGDTLRIDKNFYFEVLAPGAFLPQHDLQNLNNTSIVLMLHYGDFKMLLTGDAEAPVEDALQQKYGAALKADVLKVGHHGSRTSSIYKFISKVKPQYALISCGDFSIYHHPHKNVVGSLQHLGAKVFTTHNKGSLVVTTDGKTFAVHTEK